MKHQETAPWRRTVAMLSIQWERSLSRINIVEMHGHADWSSEIARDPYLEPSRVSINERLTERTLSVAWSDSQCGQIGEQLWRRVSAEKPGHCVVSGKTISRGDPVFMPSRRTIRASATDWMIAEEHVKSWGNDAS